MTIYLARHGQTAYNRTRRFQGQLDVPLDETGLVQAKELAARVAGLGVRALWASPLSRARQTAEAVAAHVGLPVRFDDRLMETDTGEWTDRFYEELRAHEPAAYQAFLNADESYRFPGGESYAEQADRVMAAIADIERHPVPALVVCHGGVIRLAMSRRTGTLWSPGEQVTNTAVVELPPRR